MGWYYILCVLCERNVKSQARSFWCAKYETKTNLSIPKLEALTLTTYSPNIFIIYLSHCNYYIYIHTIVNYFRYRIQIEVFDAIDKTNFVIFDRDAKKILKKSTRNFWKINWGTTYLNYYKTIDIGEGIPRDLKKKRIFLLHLNEFNIKGWFWKLLSCQDFLCTFKWQKGMGEKIYIHNPICYINYFCCTIPKLTKIKNKKNLQKTVTSLKFNKNANTYKKS